MMLGCLWFVYCCLEVVLLDGFLFVYDVVVGVVVGVVFDVGVDVVWVFFVLWYGWYGVYEVGVVFVYYEYVGCFVYGGFGFVYFV